MNCVLHESWYTYCGRIELADKLYTETQPGEDGIDRLVWMFPIRPVPEYDVKKPSMFVFMDWEASIRTERTSMPSTILGRKEKPGEQHHEMSGTRSSERVLSWGQRASLLL